MANTRESNSIPVIALTDGSTECARDLVNAARHWGFLYISAGSDIPPNKISRLFELVRLLRLLDLFSADHCTQLPINGW